MGLRDTFKNAAKSIVTAFGDVGVSTVYAQFSSATYNASAGSVGETFASTAGVIVIIETFTAAQIDGQNVQPNDKKVLIPAKNISGIVPKPADRVHVSTDVWNVVDVKVDPAEALWELQVRRA